MSISQLNHLCFDYQTIKLAVFRLKNNLRLKLESEEQLEGQTILRHLLLGKCINYRWRSCTGNSNLIEVSPYSLREIWYQLKPIIGLADFLPITFADFLYNFTRISWVNRDISRLFFYYFRIRILNNRYNFHIIEAIFDKSEYGWARRIFN